VTISSISPLTFLLYVWCTGVGEYVTAPDPESAEKELFSVTRNAIVVNKALPEALAAAALLLVRNSTLRHELGKQGAETVRKHFSTQRQMREYESLYFEMLRGTTR
jgi:glycosyltransferase involved in cell wall biosynthesis